MRFTNGKFTEAYFVNEKKDAVSTFFQFEDGTSEAVLIPVDLNNELYLKLLDQFTVDQISAFTANKIQRDKENFTNFVMQICEQRGLVYDPNAADVKSQLVLDNLFNVPEGDAGTDLLFNIKMKCFELPEVVASENTELKKELRKATTPLQAFYIAGKFLYE